MLRVYDSLRRRIMTGAFAPGHRLDPARLAEEHNASVTPVRDALHRLTGERLIESWQQEGFYQPVFTEALLRDLYGWSGDLLDLAVRRSSARAEDWQPVMSAEPYADRVAALCSHLAQRTDHRELWHAIEGLNARLYLARATEVAVLEHCEEDFQDLIARLAEPTPLRRALHRYHRRRIRAAPQIAAALRPDPERRSHRP